MATAKPEPTTTTTTVTTVTSLATPAFAALTSTIVVTINDANLTFPPFSGTPQENSKEWMKYFICYVTFKQLSEPAIIALFALLMKGTADTWFSSFSETDRTSFTRVTAFFDAKYAPAPISLWRRASEFWSRDQKPQESVEEYYADMARRANEVGASADMTRYALIRGLRPELRTYVLQQNPTTITAFLDAAKIAEARVIETGPSVNAQILEAINRLENKASINAVDDSRRVTFSCPVATSALRSPVLTPHVKTAVALETFKIVYRTAVIRLAVVTLHEDRQDQLRRLHHHRFVNKHQSWLRSTVRQVKRRQVV